MRETLNQIAPGGPHWSEAGLVNHLYGLDSENGALPGHFATCPDCASRLAQLRERRSVIATEPDVPAEYLRAQRLLIHRRIEEKRWGWKWQAAPVALTGLLLAIGLMLQQPGPPPQPDSGQLAAISDTQLFEELSLAASRHDVRGAEPIQALFVAEPQ